MTDKIARTCDYCGKTDLLVTRSDSSGMILVQGDKPYLLLMRDLKKKELARPSFNLTGKAYCPECLPKAISEWVEKVIRKPYFDSGMNAFIGLSCSSDKELEAKIRRAKLQLRDDFGDEKMMAEAIFKAGMREGGRRIKAKIEKFKQENRDMNLHFIFSPSEWQDFWKKGGNKCQSLRSQSTGRKV